MQRIVLDTNCLLMSIPRKSPYHQILLDFLAGKYLLCVSNEVVLEYEEILTRKVGSLVANNIINAILASSNTIFINPQKRYQLIKSDPDDNKFVDCAISANAKYIVSQDHHYDVIRFNPEFDFTAIDIDAFLAILKGGSLVNFYYYVACK